MIGLALGLFLTAVAFGQGKLDELDNPKDYSNDYQLPPASGSAPRAPFFVEGFEGGVPPAGWTVTDLAGSGLVWTGLGDCGEAGNFTGGGGDCACASSDMFGVAPFSTELISKPISMSCMGNLELSCVVNFQNWAGDDFFEISYSIDGGANWVVILSWNEDHGAFRDLPGEAVSLDISNLAGETGVLFKFHYWSQSPEPWNWYVQVDDFEIAYVSDDGDDVPATSVVGLALLLMAVVGTGVYFIRRREAS
jgi:hypothetical protein